MEPASGYTSDYYKYPHGFWQLKSDLLPRSFIRTGAAPPLLSLRRTFIWSGRRSPRLFSFRYRWEHLSIPFPSGWVVLCGLRCDRSRGSG